MKQKKWISILCILLCGYAYHWILFATEILSTKMHDYTVILWIGSFIIALCFEFLLCKSLKDNKVCYFFLMWIVSLIFSICLTKVELMICWSDQTKYWVNCLIGILVVAVVHLIFGGVIAGIQIVKRKSKVK